MQIKQIIQGKDGTYSFQGSLTEEEHTFLLELGLSILLEENGLPFTSIDPAQMSLDFSEEQH
jgi:hypothetical protein